jgi:hypothetical protein
MATAAGPGPSSSPWDGRQQVLADHNCRRSRKKSSRTSSDCSYPPDLELTKAIHTMNLARSTTGQDRT